MDPRRLTSLLRAVPGPLATRVLDYVAELTPDQLSAIRGLGTRLAVITESHVGRYLAPGEPSQTIDVRAALDGPEVVLFSLNSSSYGTLAAQLGTLAVQDLVTAVGGRMGEAAAGRPLAIMGVDEFSALGGDQLAALFARGREAGVCVLVATQELVDLERAARGLRDQILGNTTVKLVHRQDVPASALMVSQMIGTEMVWEETRQIDSPFGADTGRGTRRPVERFLVHPNTIKTLPRGQAVVIVKEPESSVRIVRVMPPATLERAAGAASLAPARAWDPPGRGGAAEHAGAAHGGASPTRHVDPTPARHIDPSPAARQAAPTPAPARRPPPDRGPELG
jgi:hypothetical protein